MVGMSVGELHMVNTTELAGRQPELCPSFARRLRPLHTVPHLILISSLDCESLTGDTKTSDRRSDC